MAGDQFDAVLTALGQLPDDADHTPDAVLASRMRQLVQARAMADAALAAQLRVFDARGAAGYDGQTSTLAWQRARLRLGADASTLLKVARQVHGLPGLAKAFTAGQISLEHAAAVARLVATVGAEAVAGYEPILLQLARQAPPEQLRIACRHLRQLLDPDGDGEHAARQRRHRYLSAARTLHGMVHLQGLLDAASGEVLLAALKAAMPVPGEHDDRTTTQRRVDALSDICAGWLAAGDAPTHGGVRPQVQVTVSLRRLRTTSPLGIVDDNDRAAWAAGQRVRRPLFGLPADQFPDGIADGVPGGVPGDVPDGRQPGDVPIDTDGQPISVAQARRLACDAGIIPAVLGSDGEVLDIGRQSRVAPLGLRRALNLRDGGCRFPGCDRPASWCDVHHIIHWADGGPTNIDNCILACAVHHTLLHEGWRLHGHPNGTIWFQRPDGTRLDLLSQPATRPPIRGP